MCSIQKCLFFSGNLNSEMPGDSTSPLLHREAVLSHAICDCDMQPIYAFSYSVFPDFHTVFADFTPTHRRGVFCDIYTYFENTVPIYVISGPGSPYLTALVLTTVAGPCRRQAHKVRRTRRKRESFTVATHQAHQWLLLSSRYSTSILSKYDCHCSRCMEA